MTLWEQEFRNSGVLKVEKFKSESHTLYNQHIGICVYMTPSDLATVRLQSTQYENM